MILKNLIPTLLCCGSSDCMITPMRAALENALDTGNVAKAARFYQDALDDHLQGYRLDLSG